MFDMSNDSHLFRTRAELEAEGYRLVGNAYVQGDPTAPSAVRYLPLYEAKMIWHYDHRYGTYEGVRDRSSTQLPTPDAAQHADPRFLVQPWYWVPAEEVEARLGDWQRGWLIGFRNVTTLYQRAHRHLQPAAEGRSRTFYAVTISQESKNSLCYKHTIKLYLHNL